VVIQDQVLLGVALLKIINNTVNMLTPTEYSIIIVDPSPFITVLLHYADRWNSVLHFSILLPA
jgi:hypothetical protein